MLSRSAKHSSSLHLCVMSSTPSNSDKVCEFFDRGKYCRFGRRCKFLHTRSTSDNTENQSCSSKQPEERVVGEVSEGAGAVTSPTVQDDVPEQRKLCFYFSKYNRCRYGKGCRYEHIRDEVLAAAKSSVKQDNKKEDDVTTEDGNEKQVRSLAEPEQDDGKKSLQRPKRVCRYFKAGHCSMGQRCKFRHPESLVTTQKENVEEGKDESRELKEEGKSRQRRKYQPRGRPNIFIIQELSAEDLEKCRSDELAQLKKRFPKCEEDIDENGAAKIQLIFVPSDPDWPYDVRFVPLLLEFKKDYPQSRLEASVVESSEIPHTVHRVISEAIKSWLQLRFDSFSSQGKVEQVVRPMLKWLDRTVEDMFTAGLKQYQKEMMARAAGLTFVSATELKEQYASHSQDSDEASSQDSAEEDEEDSDEEEEDEEGSESEGEELAAPRQQIVIDPAARGTEVRFQNLQLKNSLATLMATKVSMQLQCSRCRAHNTVSTPVGRSNAVSCGTCAAVFSAAFRAAMVHEGSAVMGYADVDGCTVFDIVLPECTFAAGCLACSKEMALEGVSTGQPKDTWCRSCNAKMRIVAESIRFLRLQPAVCTAEDENAHKVNMKQNRVPKDPAIKDGFPLPDDGICKHFKKSYRWFRFPCCGKAYPCDACHDEKEDHPYTYANRMLCGHCAKEQPYAAERPCIRCGESLTRKSSSHWEGGKGCRDKIKMARDDVKKYSNLNKTISRKAQGIATGKKNTKLRHT